MISKEDIEAMKPGEPEKRVYTGWGSHRWSGWPGAYCMLCGMSDPHESAVADGEFPFPLDLDKPTQEEQEKMKQWYIKNDAQDCPRNGHHKDPYKIDP